MKIVTDPRWLKKFNLYKDFKVDYIDELVEEIDKFIGRKLPKIDIYSDPGDPDFFPLVEISFKQGIFLENSNYSDFLRRTVTKLAVKNCAHYLPFKITKNIQPFVDFYAMTIGWQLGINHNKADVDFVRGFLDPFKVGLYNDISTCVESELGYYEPLLPNEHADPISRGIIAFADYREWDKYYGGRQWELICINTLAMMKNKNINQDFVFIDRVIDSVHNCGPCLDKIYNKYTLEKMLEWKKFAAPYFIIERSSREIRAWAMSKYKEAKLIGR